MWGSKQQLGSRFKRKRTLFYLEYDYIRGVWCFELDIPWNSSNIHEQFFYFFRVPHYPLVSSQQSLFVIIAARLLAITGRFALSTESNAG